MGTEENDPQPDSFHLQLSEKVILLALHVYLFSFLGCYIARDSFVRQTFYVFQLLRLFLVMAGVLPCVLHCQLSQLLPNTTEEEFPLMVAALLLANVLLALAAKALIAFLLLNYKKNTRVKMEQRWPRNRENVSR
ncbi:uncharacterized protein LOC106011677 [Aplysia californica]|uniref:Uncharacterized protein LOC106011677 n=1 Tax=Aplysia californica TaxID=6500 RepID=A0ABM0ZZ89_APLCA|nr:uncharacterized protein LOC106011677 [Aplysia californica]